jgi:hypothetical protein
MRVIFLDIDRGTQLEADAKRAEPFVQGWDLPRDREVARSDP